jgi:uncharacterized protein YjbJ (UPF0337 family)
MADKITNTYHSAMGATKETIGKIVHNEHLMESGRAERAQASAKSGKHIAEDANQDANQVQTSETQTTVVETPANTQSAGQPLQDDNRRASNEHLAFMT